MSLDRRDFLGMTCSCLGLLAASGLSAESLSEGEEKSMADMTLQHLTQGYWSADSLLLSAAKHLKKSEDYVQLAVGFGGGIQQKDLCGFLTGGVMAIGLFAGATRGNDKPARQKCHKLTKEYMAWWKERHALKCKDIGQPCDYKSMAKEASDFLQSMFGEKS